MIPADMAPLSRSTGNYLILDAHSQGSSSPLSICCTAACDRFRLFWTPPIPKGFQQAHKHLPNVILTDILMTDIDGLTGDRAASSQFGNGSLYCPG
jgi:hypothetical protein